MKFQSTYLCLENQTYSHSDYSIVPLRKSDIFLIKNWRNEQIDILRQRQILTDEDQDNYFQDVVVASFGSERPSVILFSFLIDSICVGYGGLTNIDWESRRAELSFVLNTERTKNLELYEKELSIFIKLIKKVTFEDLNFNRIFTETYDIRPHHINILERNGFFLEGRMRQHVRINHRYVDSLVHGCLKANYHD